MFQFNFGAPDGLRLTRRYPDRPFACTFFLPLDRRAPEREMMLRDDKALPGAYEAPVILWDSIQAMGIADGLAHMTLCVSLSIPDGTGGVNDQSAAVAHLRMSTRALGVLKEAIAKIELMAKLTPPT